MNVQHAFQSAVQLHNANRLGEAEALYRQVLSAQPNHPDALRLLGLIHTQTARLDEAIRILRHAASLYPNDPQMHFDLANALGIAGDSEAAIESLRRAVALRPEYFEAHNNIADLMLRLGRFDDAIASARRAVELRHDCVEAHFTLGNAMLATKRFAEAADSYRRAAQLRPTFGQAIFNLGVANFELGRLDEAMDAYTGAARLMPDAPLVHFNIGTVHSARWELEQAEACYRRAIALDPNYLEAINNLGTTLRKQGGSDESLACYERGLVIDPNSAELHWNRGFSLLLHGDYERGFADYEWRWRWTGFGDASRPPPPQPRWHGEALDGKTILLTYEQAFGDLLLFARYIPLLRDRGAKVMVEAPPPLQRLIRLMPSVERVVAQDEQVECDLYCPIMSLALELDTTNIDAIPRNVPYLQADSADVAKWKSRIDAEGAKLRVGVIWAGRPTPPGRSVPLAQLAPLAHPDIAFFSLQKDEPAAEAKHPPACMRLIDCGDDLHDFADTAAAMMNLDIIISVDTAAAHLAGALARPTFTLLQHAPDWRWLRERPDSPWFPTMRLFRQQTRGDWSPPIAELARALHERMGEPARPRAGNSSP